MSIICTITHTQARMYLQEILAGMLLETTQENQLNLPRLLTHLRYWQRNHLNVSVKTVLETDSEALNHLWFNPLMDSKYERTLGR